MLEWDEPFARWFADGKLNASVNALDRHVAAGRGSRVAFYFEGEGGDRRTITYADMLADVCRFANGLKKLGIQKGERVAIYMPMIPEAVVAMLACARLGITHTVIFGGFSARSDRRSGQRCASHCHYRDGRRLASRQEDRPQSQLRLSDGAHADGEALHRLQPYRRSRRHARGP